MNERDLTFPGSGLRIMHEATRISLSITDEDGRSLLSIHRNGSVTGSVEDASEAGAAFVAYLRQHMVDPPLIAPEPQGEPSEEAEDLIRAIADELTPGRRDKDLVIAARELRLAAENVEPSEAQVTGAAREYHERGNGEGSFDRMADHVRTSLLFRMGCALRAAGSVR